MTHPTLRQWAENGWLKPHETSPREIETLLDGADRKLADAEVDQISNDGRFQFAYEAILRLSIAALAASGFRASSNNHHYRSLASLPHTVGATDRQARILDDFRRKRNTSVYDVTGEISQAELDEALAQARALRRAVRSWLVESHPELAPR